MADIATTSVRTFSRERLTLAALTAEEKLTHRNWRRATLTFYAAFSCAIAAILIAIGPLDQSGATKSSDIHSAFASSVQRSSR